MISRKELRDITIAVLALTFIFWLVMGSYSLFSFATLSLVVVISFLFHELAHRWVANKFGYLAFFKLFPAGILFGILFALVGFVFVAPGAVMIYPKVSLLSKSWRKRREEFGLISAAGPLMNIVFALTFFFIRLPIASFLTSINSWLAFFNLWPIPPLDGSKVIVWRWQIWLLLIGIAGLLVYLQF